MARPSFNRHWRSSQRVKSALLFAAFAFGSSGCDALIEPPPAPPISVVPGPTGPGPTVEPEAPRAPAIPAPPSTARLSAGQFKQALGDLLGQPLPAFTLDADTAPYLFQSIGASTTAATERTVDQWETAIRATTQVVFADAARRQALVGCNPTRIEDPCVDAFLKNFGLRAYRHPVPDAELATVRGIVQKFGGIEVWRGLRAGVTAMLQSPRFLYRLESPAAQGSGRRALDGYEVATRLSYLVLNAAPDRHLLDLAAKGELSTAEGIKAEIERLLKDPRARTAAKNFFSEYLGVDGLETVTKDATLYPTWNPTLAAAMREEVERFAERALFEGAGVRELLDGRTTVVNPLLLSFYGVTPMGGAAAPAGWSPMALPPERGGLMSLPGVLAFTAHPNMNSPTRRGIFVRERLLCESVPAPPPDVTTSLAEEKPGDAPKTIREKLEEHRTNPACAGCHSTMDPIGLGLERFDAIGKKRDLDNGKPVDSTGTIAKKDFDGAAELGALLKDDARVMPCMVKQLYRRAMGRTETVGERNGLLDMADAFKAGGYTYQAMLEGIATHDMFRFVGEETP